MHELMRMHFVRVRACVRLIMMMVHCHPWVQWDHKLAPLVASVHVTVTGHLPVRAHCRGVGLGHPVGG